MFLKLKSTCPGGSFSASETLVLTVLSNTGALSFTSITVIFTDAVAERGGLPPSVAYELFAFHNFTLFFVHLNVEHVKVHLLPVNNANRSQLASVRIDLERQVGQRTVNAVSDATIASTVRVPRDNRTP